MPASYHCSHFISTTLDTFFIYFLRFHWKWKGIERLLHFTNLMFAVTSTVCPLNSFNFIFAVCAWLIASVIRQPTVLAGQVYKVKAKSNGKNRPKFPVLYKRTRVNVDFIQNYQQYSCTLKRALKQQTARAICT